MSASGVAFPWQESREKMPQLVRGLFAEAAEEGSFEVRDPEVSLWLLLGGMRTIIRFGDQPRPDDLAARIIDNLIDGAAHRK